MEIIIWAWEIQITQSIYVPEETSGHQGSNYFQMSIIYLIYYFTQISLLSSTHSPFLPFSPKAISLLQVFLASNFLPLQLENKRIFWGIQK